MSKRKLTDQQRRRVNKNRKPDHTVLPEKNTDDKGIESFDGLVITNFGKHLLVESLAEKTLGQIFHCSVRQHLGKLVAGDRVTWLADQEAHKGVVTKRLERHHLLTRPGFRGQTRMVGANIDQILVMAPIEPGVYPDMIDRYLVAAHQLDLPVVILLNKVDLIASDEHWESIAELLVPYDELDIPIYPISTESHEGLNDLLEALDGKNNVIVGPSGAGKSSLIKTLVPDIDIKIAELSESTGLGKHTTTNPILYHLPQKLGLTGNIIDSPGVREFTPSPCDLQSLEQAYPDFEPFLGNCKFHNCSHSNEPNCAIKAALETEQIFSTRYQSFQRLRQEFTEAGH